MAGLYDDLLYTPPATGGKKPQYPDEGPDVYGPTTTPAPDRMQGLYDDLLEPESAPRNYTELEALQAMPGNYIPSAQKYIEAFGHAVTNPGESLPALWNMVQGFAAMHPGNIAGVPGRPAGVPKDDMQNLEAIHKDNHEVLGSWDNFKRVFAEDPVRLFSTVLAFLPGGSVSGLMPATAGRVARVAAGVGDAFLNPLTIAEPVAKGAGHAVRAGMNRATISPEARTLYKATEGTGGQQRPTLDALESAQSYVPGNPLSAGEAVAQRVTVPDFQGLQVAANKREGVSAVHTTRQRQQNNAQIAELERVMPHADNDAAVAARGDRAAQSYANAGVVRDLNNPPPYPVANVMVQDDPAFAALQGRPGMDRAMTQAREIAANFGREFQVGETTPGGPVPSSLFGPDGRPVMTDVAPTFAQYPAQSMHFLKQALDDLIKDPERHGIGATEVASLRAIRDPFVQWFEGQNPAYGNARRQYAADSLPIDQTALLNYYRRKLVNPLTGDDAAKLNALSFINARDSALNEALGNTSLYRATGEKRWRHEGDLLSPEQVQALDSIQAERTRAKVAEEEAANGRQFGNVINNMVEAPQAPSLLNIGTSLVNYLSRVVSGQLGERAANNLANAMQTPEGAATILRQAVEQHNALNDWSVPFHIGGNTVATFNRRGAPVINALSEQQNRKQK